jgi:aspartate ammonia-lyase
VEEDMHEPQPTGDQSTDDTYTDPTLAGSGAQPPTRTETDSLGSVEVPADAYWGVHTMRALENFPISKRPISVYPDLVVALASVKQAAARANREVGVLTDQKAAWIDDACQRIIDGELHDQFVVGVIQGGAGTSTNMNANEVIATLALEIAGYPKGRCTRSTTSTGASRRTTRIPPRSSSR